MVLFDKDIVMDVYDSLPFKINGIGEFHDRDGKRVVATYSNGEWKDISVGDGVNGGYIRTQGALNTVATEPLTCDNYYYLGTQELHLVVGLFGYNLQNVQTKVLALTQSISGQGIQSVKIKTVTADKAQILTDEGIEPNDLEWFKIVFELSFNYITDENGCITSLCGSSGNTPASDCIEFTGIRDLAISGNTTTLIDDIF